MKSKFTLICFLMVGLFVIHLEAQGSSQQTSLAANTNAPEKKISSATAKEPDSAEQPLERTRSQVLTTKDLLPFATANQNTLKVQLSPDFSIIELDELEIFDLPLAQVQTLGILTTIKQQDSLEGALDYLSLKEDDNLVFQAIENERLKHEIFYQRTLKRISQASADEKEEDDLPSPELLNELRAKINVFLDTLTARLNQRFAQEDIHYAISDYPERRDELWGWYFKNLNTITRLGTFNSLASLYALAETRLLHKHPRFYEDPDSTIEDYNHWVNKQQRLSHEISTAALYYMDQLLSQYPKLWKEIRENQELHPTLKKRYEHLEAIQTSGPICREVFLQLTMPAGVIDVVTKPTR